jgi:hypothetical protein
MSEGLANITVIGPLRMTLFIFTFPRMFVEGDGLKID